MSDAHNLAGLRVLVTRPAGQGEALVAAIQAAGGQALQYPLLVIEPVRDPLREAGIRQCIQDLDHYHILIFVSTNAARFGLEWIDRYWPQLPTGLEVVAVGPATAEKLAALPAPVHTAATGMQSEDILQLPLLTRVEGKKIALFRGVGGRELLADTLRARGARVDYIETYERLEPPSEGKDLPGVLREQRINAISITSGQMLTILCKLVDIKQNGIYLLPLLVPSERVREAALAAGFSKVFSCGGATDEAIVATLADIAGRQND